MVLDTNELLCTLVDSKKELELGVYIYKLNKLNLDVGFFYDNNLMFYRVTLRNKDFLNKSILISCDSTESFIDALGKAFSIWYTVYCPLTLDELKNV